jgi:hypothetical protein
MHERDRERKFKESYLHNNLTPQPSPAVRQRELSGEAFANNSLRSAKSHRTSDANRHASEVPPEGKHFTNFDRFQLDGPWIRVLETDAEMETK